MIKVTEIKIKDKLGNIVISPGLKVYSKEGVEYTVAKIVKDKTGKIVILMNKPDAPRFIPQRSKESLVDSPKKYTYVSESIEDFSTEYYTPEETSPPSKEDLFAVSQEEFERNYEVK